MKIELPSFMNYSKISALCVAMIAVSVAASSTLQADTIYWGGTTALWNSTANWSTDSAAPTPNPAAIPGSGDDTVFNISTATGNVTIGLQADQASNSMTFLSAGTVTLLGTGTSGSGTARLLTIGSGGITVNSGSGGVTFGSSSNTVNVRLGASQTWTNNSAASLTIRNNAKGISTGSDPVTLTINAASSGSITDSGTLSDGDGGAKVSLVVASTGTGVFNVAGGNFSGGTTVLSGVLTATGTTPLGASSGGVILGDTAGSANATLNINASSTIGNNFTVRSGSSGVKTIGSNSNAIFDGTLLLNDALSFNQSASSSTINGVVSGAGTLTKMGAGTLVLAGNNTYAGGTILSAGTLRINNGGTGSGNSSIGTGTLTIGGGTLDNTSGSAVALGTNNDQVWNASFTFTGTNNLNLGNGSVSLGAVGSTRTVTTTSGVLTIGGVISNGAAGTSITKAGNGTLALTSSSSTYTGNTQISAGVLEVMKLSNAGVASSIGAGSNATIGSTVLNGTGTLRYIGSGDSTNRVLTIGGGGGGTLDASGSGALNFTNSSTSAFGSSNVAYVFNLSGNSTANNTYAANQANNGTGAFSVVKNGTGKWILSGNSTYTGSTTVNSGTLLINGSTAAGSAVTVNGGKLGGTGTIGGTVTVNSGATLSPGASIESLATGSNTWNGGGALDMEFSTDGSTGTAGIQWDLLAITGGLDLTGAGTGSFTINLFTMANATTPGLLAVWNPNVSHTWSGFVTTTTGFTGFSSDKFVFNLSGFQNTINGSFSVVQNLNNLDLVYSSIPEPSVWMLLAFSLTALVVLRRRRV